MHGGPFDVAGRTVVVTGGSRGIGAMIAGGFAEAGAEVVIVARREEALERAARELSAAGGHCRALVADLSSPAGIEACADRLRELCPRLDVLVNNAGATWGAPLEEYPQEGWQKVIDTNLRGPFFLTTALLPYLRADASEARPARVINVGSVEGAIPSGMENYAYTASKAGLHMLTRHLALRLAREHVTVNALLPGPFATKMLAFALEETESRQALLDEIPLGRLGRPREIAGAAIFLASDAGAFTTGALLPVDGGASIGAPVGQRRA